MFNTFVRSKIEYGSQVWNPHFKMDIDMLERVQRRYTKFIPGLFDISYPDRMKNLGIVSMELRRVHLDLTFAYKIIHGKMKVDFAKYFKLSENQTRGNGLKLQKPWAVRDIRFHFFSHRVVNIWNSLPNEVVFATNVSRFKRLLKTEAIEKILLKFVKGRGLDVLR
jgi:ribonuclease P/MRP protein subunit RPP40